MGGRRSGMRLVPTVLPALFFLGVLAVLPTVVVCQVPATERQALVDLYDATNGTGWLFNTYWLVGDPCENSWYRVTCNATSGPATVT